MRRFTEKVFRCWGTELTLRREGAEWRLRGFLQHSGSKSWRSMEKNVSPLGQIPGGQYVYIGPAQPAAAAGDVLRLGDKEYELRRAELVWLRNKPLYCWGLCVERGGEPIWQSPS